MKKKEQNLVYTRIIIPALALIVSTSNRNFPLYLVDRSGLRAFFQVEAAAASGLRAMQSCHYEKPASCLDGSAILTIQKLECLPRTSHFEFHHCGLNIKWWDDGDNQKESSRLYGSCIRGRPT